jgi:hypothetical protein
MGINKLYTSHTVWLSAQSLMLCCDAYSQTTRQTHAILLLQVTAARHTYHLNNFSTELPAVAYKVAQCASSIGPRLFLVIAQQHHQGRHCRAQRLIQAGVVERCIANGEARELPASI